MKNNCRLIAVRFAVAIVLGGCDSPLRPADAIVSPAMNWAGGTVRVSHLASARDTLLYVGDTRLEFRRESDVISVTLPTTANGRVEIQRRGARAELVGEVDVVGFADSSWYPGGWTGNPLLWPRQGPASFIAGNAEGKVSVFEVASGSVRVLFDRFTIRYGAIRAPGLTPDPNVFLFGTGYQDGVGVEAWRIDPVVEHVGTYAGVNSLRQLVLVNDSVWLQAGHQQIRRLQVNGTQIVEYSNPEAQGGAMSPRGDRTAFRVYARSGRIPVFNEVGDTAFSITGVLWTSGVAFSPSGDTLYAAGSPSSIVNVVNLRAFDATTGKVLSTIEYPGYFPQDMLSDVSGRWLMIAMTKDYGGALDGGGMHVLVVDRRTMQLAGHMEAPFADRCYFCDITIVDGSDGVFLAVNGGSSGMRTYRFRRP